jgi:hypothetical protein
MQIGQGVQPPQLARPKIQHNNHDCAVVAIAAAAAAVGGVDVVDDDNVV